MFDVFLNGHLVTEMVLDFPSIDNIKTFRRDSPVLSEISLLLGLPSSDVCVDIENIFGGSVRIESDNGVSWKGLVYKVVYTQKQSISLYCRPNLWEVANRIIEYKSDGFESFYKIVSSVLDEAGIEYHSSLKTLSNKLENSGVLLKVDVDNYDCLRLFSFLKKISETVATVFFIKDNKVYFEDYSYNDFVTLDENHFLSPISVSYDQSAIVNSLAVGYEGDRGISETEENYGFALDSQIRFGTYAMAYLRSSDGEQFILPSKEAAAFVLQRHIKNTHANSTTPKRRMAISFSISPAIYRKVNERVAIASSLFNGEKKIFTIYSARYENGGYTINAYEREKE